MQSEIFIKKIKVNLLGQDICIGLISNTYFIFSKLTGTQLCFISTLVSTLISTVYFLIDSSTY